MHLSESKNDQREKDGQKSPSIALMLTTTKGFLPLL